MTTRRERKVMFIKELLEKSGVSAELSGALLGLADAVFDEQHKLIDRMAEDKSLWGGLALMDEAGRGSELLIEKGLQAVGIHSHQCGKRIGVQVQNELTEAFSKAAAEFNHALNSITKMLLLDKTKEIRDISEAVHNALVEEANAREDGKKSPGKQEDFVGGSEPEDQDEGVAKEEIPQPSACQGCEADCDSAEPLTGGDDTAKAPPESPKE